MNLSENDYPSQIAVASAEPLTEQADNPLEQPVADANPLPSLNPPASQGNVRTFLRETLETIALTLIIFVVIRAGVQNFRIEGFSMEPNFHDGQYLLVSKIDYLIHAPERGDVVVCRAATPSSLVRLVCRVRRSKSVRAGFSSTTRNCCRPTT